MMIYAKKFTFIELLVMITILLVLAMFLLPVLQKSLIESWKTLCQNQQRQIGIGVLAYCDDHYGAMPNYMLDDYTPNYVWNERNFYTSFIGQPVGLGDVLVSGYLGPDGRDLPFKTYATPPAIVNDFWRTQADIFRCPGMSISPGPITKGEVYTSSVLGAFASSDYVTSGTKKERLRHYFEKVRVYKSSPVSPWTSVMARRTLYMTCFFNAQSYPDYAVPHGGDAPCWILDGSAKVLPGFYDGALQAMFLGSAYEGTVLRNDVPPTTATWLSSWFYYAQYFYEHKELF